MANAIPELSSLQTLKEVSFSFILTVILPYVQVILLCFQNFKWYRQNKLYENYDVKIF